jgi:hypothetical protein
MKIARLADTFPLANSTSTTQAAYSYQDQSNIQHIPYQYRREIQPNGSRWALGSTTGARISLQSWSAQRVFQFRLDDISSFGCSKAHSFALGHPELLQITSIQALRGFEAVVLQQITFTALPNILFDQVALLLCLCSR